MFLLLRVGDSAFIFVCIINLLIKYIIMKNNQMLIPFLGATSPANHESAPAGVAADCLNLRERENALQAMGNPVTLATQAPGERLLCHDGDR